MKKRNKRPFGHSILVLDTSMNEVKSYSSQTTVGIALGVSNEAIHDRLKQSKTGLIKNRYAIKYENDNTPWEIVKTKRRTCVKRLRSDTPKYDLDDPELQSFKTLEKFPGIRIFSNGLVIRETTGSSLGTPNKDGYLHCTLRTSDGDYTNVGIHRLVAMAYLGCPENMEELHVNHIDFDPSNNSVENLEWVTPYDNSKHSGYHNSESGIKFKPIQVRDFDTKEVRLYDSIAMCSRELRIHKDSIQLRVKKGDGYLWEERLQYRLNSKEEAWCEEPDSSFIQSLDLKTGVIRLYKNAAAFCHEHDVLASTLTACLTYRKWYPVNKRYIVKYEKEYSTPFPKVDDIITYIAKNTQFTPIVAENSVTREKKIFLSAADCAREMSLAPSTLGMRLKSSKPSIVYSDGYSYMYYGPNIPK